MEWGLAFNGERGYYLPFRHPEHNLPLEWLGELWGPLGTARRLVGHNLKFDLAMMYQDGYEPPVEQHLVDTMVIARMCSADRYPDLSLSGQLEAQFGEGASSYEQEFKDFLRKNKWTRAYHLAPAARVGEYCVGDVVNTWRLLDLLEGVVQETNQGYVWEQEQELTHVLLRMELLGMRYDPEYCSAKISQLQAKIQNCYQELWLLAGREFNPNSNKQLTEVMHGLDIHSPKKSSKTGDDSWDVGVLLSVGHPLAGKLIEIRGLEKLLGTYFEPIAGWTGGIVHCQHRNWGAVTGRMSITDPPLQTMPKNVQNLLGNDTDENTLDALSALLSSRRDGEYTDLGSLSSSSPTSGGVALSSIFHDLDTEVSVRRLFLARPQYRLYMLDYNQMEVRVFADYVQDAELFELLDSKGFDFHDYVATTVWGVHPSNPLWDFYRKLAKGLNFGLIYGMGIESLAVQLKTTRSEAEDYRREYFARFPKADGIY